MYFATLLKTTAPVKLPISQLSLILHKVNINPSLVLRYSIFSQSTP
jgi:hypothetical protein